MDVTCQSDHRTHEHLQTADDEENGPCELEGLGEEHEAPHQEPQSDEDVVRDAQRLIALADDELFMAESGTPGRSCFASPRGSVPSVIVSSFALPAPYSAALALTDCDADSVPRADPDLAHECVLRCLDHVADGLRDGVRIQTDLRGLHGVVRGRLAPSACAWGPVPRSTLARRPRPPADADHRPQPAAHASRRSTPCGTVLTSARPPSR